MSRVLVRTFDPSYATACEVCGRQTSDLPGCTRAETGLMFHVVTEVEEVADGA